MSTTTIENTSVQVGQRIAAKLRDMGVSQRQAAAALGIPRSTFNDHLTGRSSIYVNELASVLDFTGMTAHEAFGGEQSVL